jgi:hypothetical protein
MTETTHMTQNLTFAVDPARLDTGTWCHASQKTLREGDIAASYSADRIGSGQPIRAPFPWAGARWVCVSLQGFHGTMSAEAYKIADARAFAGEPQTYTQRVANGNEARSDPNGFYHGMSVTHAGTKYILCGPPARFEPGEVEQLDLFG